jgi:hypothetical protein
LVEGQGCFAPLLGPKAMVPPWGPPSQVATEPGLAPAVLPALTRNHVVYQRVAHHDSEYNEHSKGRVAHGSTHRTPPCFCLSAARPESSSLHSWRSSFGRRARSSGESCSCIAYDMAGLLARMIAESGLPTWADVLRVDPNYDRLQSSTVLRAETTTRTTARDMTTLCSLDRYCGYPRGVG